MVKNCHKMKIKFEMTFSVYLHCTSSFFFFISYDLTVQFNLFRVLIFSVYSSLKLLKYYLFLSKNQNIRNWYYSDSTDGPRQHLPFGSKLFPTRNCQLGSFWTFLENFHESYLLLDGPNSDVWSLQTSRKFPGRSSTKSEVSHKGLCGL